MKVFQYEDFNEAYMKINREIILNPDKMIDNINGNAGILNNIVIQTKSTKCDKIDMGLFGYKINKWNHLLRSYLGKEKIHELRFVGVETRSQSTSFDFSRNSSTGCIKTLFLTRDTRNRPWNKATVIWRAGELHRKFPVDLILLHRIFERIPNCELEEINLVFPFSYVSALHAIPSWVFVYGFDLQKDILDRKEEHPFMHLINRKWEQQYLPNEAYGMANVQRMLDLYFELEAGKVPESIFVDELKIPRW